LAERPLVLLDALLVRAEPTGVGRAILELTAALGAADRGCDFAVLATHPELFPDVAGAPGWRVVPCPGARGGTARKALYTQAALPRVASRLGASLLHSLQFVAPLRLPCPSVVTVHDLGYRHFPGTVEQPRRAYYRLAVPASLRRAAAVTTNSEATAADVEAVFPFTAGRVRATPYGTPSWVWRQAPARETAGAAPEAPFLFVGTLEPRKNLPGLLAAYRLFAAQWEGSGAPGRPPGLVLAGGPGWGDGPLRRPLADLQARGLVRCEGYCGPDRLWELYRSARALLFPSLHEGFGFPILEAMAARLPVLTSDRGAMREVAGDCALLADPEDPAGLAAALRRLGSEPDLRRRLAERGWERARAWTWQRAADATVEVYRAVLAGRPAKK
jgi:glycosyltransferase involved in cell wall biosynthesis